MKGVVTNIFGPPCFFIVYFCIGSEKAFLPCSNSKFSEFELAWPDLEMQFPVGSQFQITFRGFPAPLTCCQ